MNKRKKGEILKQALQALAAVVFLIVVWIIAWKSVGNELLVPSFHDGMKELGKLLVDGGFWSAFFGTLGRVFAAFALSFVAAAVFAVASYLVPAFGGFFAPIVSALRSLPTMAALLIILMWSSADVAPVVVGFMSLFPMLYAGVLAALIGVDGELVEMSKVYGVPVYKRIFSLYLPSVAPYVLRESGAALSFAVKLIVSAEVLAWTYQSLGGMMQDAKLSIEIPTMFALVIATFLTGFVLETVVGGLSARIERRVK